MKETVYQISTYVRFSIALLADSHNIDPTEILLSLRTCQPDLICIAGDILSSYRPEKDELIVREQENVLPLISQCVSVAPTFISLGNHEWMVSQEDIEVLEQTGAVVLDNSFAVRAAGDQQIVIGGLTSAIVTNFQQFREKEGGRCPYRPRHVPRGHLDTDCMWLEKFEKEAGYKILLCHHPECWSLREPFLSQHPIDLVLSGHAHGGQVRLFNQGLYAPGQGWMPKFTSGVFKGKYGSMVVSRGLSNTAGVPRFFNEPEIVYVEVGEDV